MSLSDFKLDQVNTCESRPEVVMCNVSVMSPVMLFLSNNASDYIPG